MCKNIYPLPWPRLANHTNAGVLEVSVVQLLERGGLWGSQRQGRVAKVMGALVRFKDLAVYNHYDIFQYCNNTDG